MSCRIVPQTLLVFEERHSGSLNRDSQIPETTFFVRKPSVPQRERATDFCRTEPITEPQPCDAVCIALLTDLALHEIRARTNPFRMRRDRPMSAKSMDTYYVPRIDYELHWSALSVWLKRYSEMPAIFRLGKALHPAVLALIEAARSVAKCQVQFMARSSEEYDCLSDDQLICNAIAERMRLWKAHPANALQIKAWETRLDQDKADFLERWTPAAGCDPQQLLRFDLFYAGQGGPDRGFGTTSADVVKADVSRLREALEKLPHFRGQLIEFYPYADFSTTWVIPGVILLPASAGSPWNLLNEVEACWQKIEGSRKGRLQASFTTMKGEYRYVTEEQRMFDPLWLQLSRAATYLFDTRLILDSSLDALTSADSFRHQPPAVKQPARSKPCAF